MRCHNRAWPYLASALLSCLLGPTPVRAGDLEWRGFFTTGVAFTDAKESYQGGIKRKPRIADETFLGLNLSKDLTQEWRVAAQILARSTADSAAKVDWAFVTYEPSSQWNITLGKQKIPMWMVSAYLDVGRAYPWVVPPEEVYTLFNLKAFNGGAAAYNLPLGASILTLRPYWGEVLIEQSPNAPNRDSRIRGSSMFGSALEWAYNKASLRLAYNSASWDLNLGPAVEFGTRHYEILTVGGKWEESGYWFATEYAATRDNDEDKYFALSDQLAIDAAASTDPAVAGALAARSALLKRRIGGSQAYYATLGKQIKTFLLHLTYAGVERPSSPDFSQDQTSLALGLNYDVTVDSVIKLEAKQVYVPSGSQGLFDTKPEERQSMVYRLNYSIIF